MSLTSRIEALTTYANQTTGAGDSTLSEAVHTLVDGYGGGEPETHTFTSNFTNAREIAENVLDNKGRGFYLIFQKTTTSLEEDLLGCMAVEKMPTAQYRGAGTRFRSGAYRYFPDVTISYDVTVSAGDVYYVMPISLRTE